MGRGWQFRSLQTRDRGCSGNGFPRSYNANCISEAQCLQNQIVNDLNEETCLKTSENCVGIDYNQT